MSTADRVRYQPPPTSKHDDNTKFDRVVLHVGKWRFFSAVGILMDKSEYFAACLGAELPVNAWQEVQSSSTSSAQLRSSSPRRILPTAR